MIRGGKFTQTIKVLFAGLCTHSFFVLSDRHMNPFYSLVLYYYEYCGSPQSATCYAERHVGKTTDLVQRVGWSQSLAFSPFQSSVFDPKKPKLRFGLFGPSNY